MEQYPLQMSLAGVYADMVKTIDLMVHRYIMISNACNFFNKKK